MRLILSLLLLLPYCGAIAQRPAQSLSHYLVGAVPVQNGQVVFQETFAAPTLSKAQLFERLNQFMLQIVEVKDKQPDSRITAQSAEEGLLAASVEEYIWFKRNAFVWDRALMRYQLLFQVGEGQCTATLRNIRYDYEGAAAPGTDTQYKAEDWITDREALSRDGKRLTKVAGKKFRVSTIDRKDQIFQGVKQLLEQP